MPPPAQAQEAGASDCPSNLLVNGGFESGFHTAVRPVELVGNGWTPWYKTIPGIDGINYAPDYAPRRRERDGELTVRSGDWSQELATSGATHTAGLWQRVPVEPGSQVLVQASGYGWATNGGNPLRSEPPNTYALSVGIDPFGGENPDSPEIRWTAPITFTDIWVPLALDVPVENDSVTVFLRGVPLQKLAHNVSRWDDACVRILGPAGEPTPEPTWTPRPAATLRPGAPTPTPLVATLEAMAAAMAHDLDATATASALGVGNGDWAGALGEGEGDGGQANALVTPPDFSLRETPGLPSSGSSGSSGSSAQTPDPNAPVIIPPGAWLLDHLGWLLLLAAMFVGGAVWGTLQRPGRATRRPGEVQTGSPTDREHGDGS